MDRGLIALDADVISPRIELTPDEEVQAGAGGTEAQDWSDTLV